MARFNPANPFPLLPEGSYSYLEAQAHAADADDWLGLQIAKVESELSRNGCRRRAPHAHSERQQLWIGLAAKSLLTPYLEIRRVLDAISPRKGAHIVDLGAAYARMGFLVGKCFPEISFAGYEYVGERVVEASRCFDKHKIRNARIEHADLTSTAFKMPLADVYFIYDYGTEKAIEKTLFDLKRISKTRELMVVARGNACHNAINQRHTWLKLKKSPDPEAKSSIYVADSCALQRASIDFSAEI